NRVPVNHGQRIVKRLQALGRPVEALWVPGGGHSFADENHYVVAAERIEVFLAAHLGGRVSRH
ncbi:MAG: prolyl oligopeptidase family serine peptidase, partial [Proteobacteria bacterium]|nr:prolyl oligopeptidase family serine peptidase [Pseudomonadota bacterium]